MYLLQIAIICPFRRSWPIIWIKIAIWFLWVWHGHSLKYTWILFIPECFVQELLIFLGGEGILNWHSIFDIVFLVSCYWTYMYPLFERKLLTLFSNTAISLKSARAFLTCSEEDPSTETNTSLRCFIFTSLHLKSKPFYQWSQ